MQKRLLRRFVSIYHAILAFIPKLFGLGPVVRQPQSDLPFVFQIGWWPNQQKVRITALDVEILDSRLNLMNSKSLVQIRLYGLLKGDKNWRPVVKLVHMSQHLIDNHEFSDHAANIVITPIVETYDDNAYLGEEIEFAIKQELILNSLGWGKNTYVIESQNITQSIELQQKK